MKRGMVLALFVLLCSAVAEDVGSVTFFRLSDHKRGWKPIVYCDGQKVAAIQGGKYLKILVSAGKHTFTSNNTKGGVDIDVKPGTQYFLRVEGTTLSEGRLEPADPMQ